MTRQPSGGEEAFAAWWAIGGATGQTWQTTDGRAVQIMYPGRRGGFAGPDFRDGVIILAGQRLVGAIELHLRAANWRAHGHHRDPRYDGVILHVIADASANLPTGTASAAGHTIPILTLPDWLNIPIPPAIIWPCQREPRRWEPALREWGARRFAQRVARYRLELAKPHATLDTVMHAAIAEAIGYGRTLLAPSHDQLSRWRTRRLQAILAASPVALGARCCGELLAGGAEHGWERLIALFGAVGEPRAAIIVWNAALPCLTAYGSLCRNHALRDVAQQVALTASGLPSNTITRTMTRWLGLRRSPSGALAQQGLHHLHATWCREKRCEACPARRLNK